MSCYLAGGGHLQGVQLTSDHVNQTSISLPILQHGSQTWNQKGDRLLLRRLGLSSQDFESHLDQIDERRSRITKELDASRNRISVIPRALTRLTYLTSLILSSNSLTTIPYEIYSNATHLKLLVLSENEISAIPEDMSHFLTELVTLKLDDNRIETIPYSIHHLQKLQHLQFGSEFGGNFIEHLPESISSLTALKELNISYNRIQELPDSLFEDNTSLEYINLSHNYIQNLPTALMRHLDNLKSLDLSYNQLSTISTTTLDDILRLVTRRLEFIDISNNRLFIFPAELLDQNRAQVIVRGNPFSQVLGSSNTTDEHGESYSRVVRNMTRSIVPVSEYISSLVTQNDNTTRQSTTPQGTIQEDISAIDRTLSALASNLQVFGEVNQGNLSGTITEHDGEEDNIIGPVLSSSIMKSLMNDDNPSPSPLFLSLREIAYRLLLSCIKDISDIDSVYIPRHIAIDLRNSFLQKCPVCHQPFVHEWVSTVQIKGQSAVRKVRFCSTECWKKYKKRIEERMRYYEDNQIAERRQEIIESIRQNPLQENTIEWILAAVTAANEQEEEFDLIANI